MKKILYSVITIGILILARGVFFARSESEENRESQQIVVDEEITSQKEYGVRHQDLFSVEENIVQISYIDVGQGDATLIVDNGHVMLIDTGLSSSYETLTHELSVNNISRIDALVLTHPDADHIQNADDLIQDYEIGCIYMPDRESDSQTYAALMWAIDAYDVPVINPLAGARIKFGGNADYYVVGPVSYEQKYDDNNSYSIVIRMVNNNDTLLFCGDATGEEMDEIISTGTDISAQVYKASHHGSANCGCNKESIIRLVNPDIAVVSCGKDNSYGHPHKETRMLFDNMNITLLRTDELGTIHCTSTGSGITW